MERPPRNPQEPLFGRPDILLSLLQGLIILGITLGVFLINLHRGLGEEEARALTFTTLIVANLGLILANRSRSRTLFAAMGTHNVALRWVFGGTLFFLALVLYVPSLRDLFHFAFLHPEDLLVCLGAGLIGTLWFEGLKRERTRRNGQRTVVGIRAP